MEVVELEKAVKFFEPITAAEKKHYGIKAETTN